MKINEFTRNVLIQFYIGCPVFRRYHRFNLWSKEFDEYKKIKYCGVYMSKYLYKFTYNLLLRYFNPSFVLIIYSSPIFIKFIKSGFIRYIDFRFLRFFQENFFLYRGKSDKDIEIFVHKYFQENIKKKFEEDIFYCLVKLVVKSAPQSFQGHLIKYLKYHYLHNHKNNNYLDLPAILKNNSNLFNYFLIDELTLKHKKEGLYPVNNIPYSNNLSIFDALYNFIFKGKRGGRHKSFIDSRSDPCIGFMSSPLRWFINLGIDILLNYFKKPYYSKFDFIYDFSFLCFCKWGILRGSFFYFGPLYSYKLYTYIKYSVLFEFAIEGLKDFNYKQFEIRIPIHRSAVNKNI